jgi:hypothetical protein
VWRVTGWDSKTGRDLNVGLFIAKGRNQAIMKAARRKDVSGLVLDAVLLPGASAALASARK